MVIHQMRLLTQQIQRYAEEPIIQLNAIRGYCKFAHTQTQAKYYETIQFFMGFKVPPQHFYATVA